MSRHTLEEEVTKDGRITKKSYDVWLGVLSPPNEFTLAYFEGHITWKEYEILYISFLNKKDISEEVKSLAKKGLERDITLLCSEENADRCHRRLLAKECKKYEPKLKVEHR